MFKKIMHTVVLALVAAGILTLSWYFGNAAFLLIPGVCKYLAGFAMIGLCMSFFYSSLNVMAKAANLWLKKSN